MTLDYDIKTKKELEEFVTTKLDLKKGTEIVCDVPKREEIEDDNTIFCVYLPFFNKYEKRIQVCYLSSEDSVCLISKADMDKIKDFSCKKTDIMGITATSCYFSLKDDCYIMYRGEYCLLEELEENIQREILKKINQN